MIAEDIFGLEHLDGMEHLDPANALSSRTTFVKCTVLHTPPQYVTSCCFCYWACRGSFRGDSDLFVVHDDDRFLFKPKTCGGGRFQNSGIRAVFKNFFGTVFRVM